MNRLDAIKTVVESCRTEHGLYASSHFYREPWLRDVVYSEEALLKLGYQEDVRAHLEMFLSRQRADGRIPTVLSRFPMTIPKQRFQPLVADTELLLLIGCIEYFNFTGDAAFIQRNMDRMAKCILFVERGLRLGLVRGMDWRDAMTAYKERFLLSNQALLLRVYDLLGERQKSERLRELVKRFFVGLPADSLFERDGRLFVDERVDCLGSSLLILNDAVQDGFLTASLKAVRATETEKGFLSIAPPRNSNCPNGLTSLTEPAFVRNLSILRNSSGRYQNGAIWPFVEARAIEALAKLGLVEEARKAALRLLARPGFFEYYDREGRARGSANQLMTAAAAFTAMKAVQQLS